MGKSNKSGVSIIEVIIGISILIIFISGTIFLMVENTGAVVQSREQTQAVSFAQEAFDALYSIKFRSWPEVTPGTYGLSKTPGYWIFSGSQDSLQGLTRSITITDACRCTTNYTLWSACSFGPRGGSRICSALFPDPETKRYAITVSWVASTGENKTITFSGVIAHYD